MALITKLKFVYRVLFSKVLCSTANNTVNVSRLPLAWVINRIHVFFVRLYHNFELGRVEIILPQTN